MSQHFCTLFRSLHTFFPYFCCSNIDLELNFWKNNYTYYCLMIILYVTDVGRVNMLTHRIAEVCCGIQFMSSMCLRHTQVPRSESSRNTSSESWRLVFAMHKDTQMRKPRLRDACQMSVGLTIRYSAMIRIYRVSDTTIVQKAVVKICQSDRQRHLATIIFRQLFCNNQMKPTKSVKFSQ